MPVPSTLIIKVNETALRPDQLRSVQSLEVESGVNEQAILRLKVAIGQDSQGGWAESAEKDFPADGVITVEVALGANRRALIRAYLTEFKMNFNADPCASSLEIVGMDALELLKSRDKPQHDLAGQNLENQVKMLFQDGNILPPKSGVPAVSPNRRGQPPMQAQNSLELLRQLAQANGCEAYVEPGNGGDQGFFRPITLNDAERIPTAIIIQQGLVNHVRNASFYYDLTGPTLVTADFTGADGKKIAPQVKANLRDNVSDFDKRLLGPEKLAKTEKLQRAGAESRDELEKRCKAHLEKYSWVVVGKGQLETQLYGDLLMPRRRVDVRGAAGSFSGTYLVWKVKHTFSREQHCQSFELRRKLAPK